MLLTVFVACEFLQWALTRPGDGSAARNDPWTAKMLIWLRSPDRESSQFAAMDLARQGDTRAIPRLREIMASGDQPTRTAAVKAILRIHDPAVLDFLLSALQRETDRGLVTHAILGLKRFPDEPRAVSWLLQRAREPDEMALVCIMTLGEMRAPVSDQLAQFYMEEVRTSRDFGRVRYILDALADIADEPAIRQLRSIAASGEPLFSRWASEALLRVPELRSRGVK